MSRSNRRSFLHNTSVTAAGGLAAGWVGSLEQVAKAAPSERVRVGCVGVEGRAGYLLKTFASLPNVDLVAIADVDTRKLPAAIEAVTKLQGKAPKSYQHFQKIIDDKSIDVVVVGTPDHWHAIPTILACQAGKDVYVEKPDGHNIEEGMRMVAAQKKHKRIVQMGTQARSSPHFREAMDYIRTGKLGKCLVAKAWETSMQKSLGRPEDSPAPEGVDYDLWLGPAPKRPFNIRRFHGNWRWFFDYGTGDLGNDGVHRLDFARWALSTAVEAGGEPALTLPIRVAANGGKWYFDDCQQWPDTLQVTYEYPGNPGRILTYEMRVWNSYYMYDESEGAVVYGDQGYIIIGNSRWRAFDAKNVLVAQGKGPNDGKTHIENFLDCVKTRGVPNADLATVGHPSSMLCHAGNVAWRLGRSLTMDLATETFLNDPEANALRTRPEYRKPYELPTV